MQSSTLVATRGLSILISILFFFSISLNAQIKIKERVEIAPKKPILFHTNSSSNGYPCFAGEIDPTYYFQTITVLRPCMITATSTMTCEVPVNISPNIDGTETFYAGCGSNIVFGISGAPFSCGDIQLPCNTTGNISENSASFDISGIWCCLHTNQHPIHITFSISAIPTQGDPATLYMDAYPAILDAYENLYEFPYGSGISAAALDQSGNNFEYCGDGSINFTIENPIAGVTIVEYGDTGPRSNASLMWDGSDLPNGIDSVTIFVRANYNGVTGTQGVLLKKIVPHHFTVTPDVDMIFAGESVNVRAIAKDINDEEVVLDGGKSITFSVDPGEGSFIVGSDTIPNQATVSYDMAKSDSIKYYSKLDPSILVDQYIFLCAARTEYPERNGYGLLKVISSCPVVEISKREVSPGDTAVVSIMARKNGTKLPYPADQMFDIRINTNEQYGRLRCISTGEEGTSLSGTQPFEFIAADNIDADSVVVQIKAQPVDGGGGGGVATSIGIGTKDTVQMPAGLMLKMQTSNSKIKIADSIRTAVMERNTARSVEKLRKRLNAIREKAKNKSQFDKIIEKMESRFAGTNEVTKNTNIAQNSLAKADQTVMSVEEGEHCELPVANVTIKNENQPPVIESIAYNPARKYFQIMSKVSVSAVVSDPDGDAVSVEYLPSETIELNNLGPYEITVVATDAKGAKTEKKETIYSVYVSIYSSSDRYVMDGTQNLNYEVKILPDGICQGGFQWSLEPKNTPAGNLPKEDLLPEKTDQKTTVNMAWWYAFPDISCGLNKAEHDCTYKLKEKTILEQDEFESSSEFVVYVPHTGGETSRPRIIGEPSTASLDDGKITTWFIYEKNTLSRQIGIIDPKVTSTSQFYTKIIKHENKHIEQQKTGLMANLWLVDRFWDRVKNLKATSKAKLIKQYNDKLEEFKTQELEKLKKLKNDIEKEAYDVSDQIPPFYLYQNCGRFK
jgi:hypothetical protein